MSHILELYSQSYTSLPKYLTILCFHFQVPDEKSRFDDLHVYNAQDIIVTLPTPMSVYDINFLSVYKEEVNLIKYHILILQRFKPTVNISIETNCFVMFNIL